MAEKKATKTANPAAKKAAAHPGSRAGKPNGEPQCSQRLPRCRHLGRHGRAPSRAHLTQRAGAPADRVVWHAWVREGRQDCVLLPRGQKLHDVRLHQEANLTREEDAPHQLIESAWYFTALDNATEAKLFAIVRKVAS